MAVHDFFSPICLSVDVHVFIPCFLSVDVHVFYVFSMFFMFSYSAL
jgi:hypothetical protein